MISYQKQSEIASIRVTVHVSFIRYHFISNLVLDSLKLKKLLELQGKS